MQLQQMSDCPTIGVRAVDMEPLTTATPQGGRVTGEGGSTNSQLQNPSEHTDRLLKRAFDQV